MSAHFVRFFMRFIERQKKREERRRRMVEGEEEEALPELVLFPLLWFLF